MQLLNETHDPALRCWVASAKQERTDFPIQNLPLAVFRRAGSHEAFRGGVAIGDQIIDLAAAHAAGVLEGLGAQALAAASPDLSVFAAAAFLEIGWSAPLSLAEAAVWISRGGAGHLSPASAAGFFELGGAAGLTFAQATLYIEVDLP